jgi:hypothetical protein
MREGARAARRPFVLAVAVSLAAATTALAAVPAATGDARGIALARLVARAYVGVRAQSYSQRGFVWMAATEGKVSSFRWVYGSGPSPGLSAATEHGVLVLRRGKVLWWRDDLTPPRCTTGVCTTAVPVQIVADARGLFYAYGNASRHTCYGHLHGTTPYIVGRSVWSVVGRFRAPVPAGRSERLRSTYPWGSAQSATEVDTISLATHRLLATRVAVSAGGRSPAFVRYPGRTPAAPIVKLCA